MLINEVVSTFWTKQMAAAIIITIISNVARWFAQGAAPTPKHV